MFQLSYTIHRPSRIRRRQVIGEEHELQKLSRASDLLFILWLWLKVKVHQKASNSDPYSKSALKTKSNKLGCSGMITEVGTERPTSSARQVILLSKTCIVVGSSAKVNAQGQRHNKLTFIMGPELTYSSMCSLPKLISL